MSQKTSIPKGTRDFSPEEMAKRDYIFNTIREVYKLYGFKPIETPAMENLSVLMGKYGEEGDKLLFKILNSGDFLKSFSEEERISLDPNSFAAKACDRGLRYDLTVPFARYVVQHRNEITLPFRRYQIQPVWRADRPQKGRYREFFQCDADMIGSDSLLNELELIHIMDEVFHRFGIRVKILMNNRKILSGIAEVIDAADKIIDITVAIDKLDKIGLDKVNEELRDRGLSESAIDKLQPIILLEGDNQQKLQSISSLLSSSKIGMEGVKEVEYILDKIEHTPLEAEFALDLCLARGLNYYTGAIFEVKAKDVQIGSITGGGRYDNLTGIFGMPDVSGVGISFGADRIFDVLNQLNLYPEDILTATQVLFVNFGEKETNSILPLVMKLRKLGVRTELYPDAAKLKKQLSYADNNHIPYVIMAGEREIESGVYNLKNMLTGEQLELSEEKVLDYLT